MSGGSNGGIGGMHVFSIKGSPDIVGGSRVGDDGGEVSAPMSFLAGGI